MCGAVGLLVVEIAEAKKSAETESYTQVLEAATWKDSFCSISEVKMRKKRLQIIDAKG